MNINLLELKQVVNKKQKTKSTVERVGKMQLADHNQLFRKAVEQEDATTLNLLLECQLRPETIFSVIMETGRYDLFVQFSFMIDNERYEEKIGCLFALAFNQGREDELPAKMKEYYLSPRGEGLFAHYYGLMGLGRRKESPVPYYMKGNAYWSGVIRGDHLHLLLRLKTLDEEVFFNCGKYNSRKCMEGLLLSVPEEKRSYLIGSFLDGSYTHENKEAIEYLFSYSEAREELGKIMRPQDWENDYCDFNYWLISQGFFSPNEEERELIKTHTPKLYHRLSSDV